MHGAWAWGVGMGRGWLASSYIKLLLKFSFAKRVVIGYGPKATKTQSDTISYQPFSEPLFLETLRSMELPKECS